MGLTKRARRAARYGTLRLAMVVNRRLPRRASLALWGSLGRVAPRFLPRTWRRTVEHLTEAFPELTAAERESLARRVFVEMGRNASDTMRLLTARCEEILRWVDAEDWERFEAAYARGRGVLVLTGHIGCWEMLGAYVRSRGYPLSVLARPLREQRFEDLMYRLRKRYGAEPMDPRRRLRAAMATLRSGGVVGLLLDLNTGAAGVKVDFFGRPAWTPLSAAWLARRSGAMIVPMAIGLRPDGRQVVRVLPPFDLDGGGYDDLETGTARCAAAVEELIRHDPSQWVWFHPRWRDRRRAPADPL
jgi:KDO2-lipid IV(A) lauroyltransferase